MPDESRSPWDRRDGARQPRDVAGKLPSEQPEGRPSAHGRPRETIMTPDTQQARAGYRRRSAHRRAGRTAPARPRAADSRPAGRTGSRCPAARPPDRARAARKTRVSSGLSRSWPSWSSPSPACTSPGARARRAAARGASSLASRCWPARSPGCCSRQARRPARHAEAGDRRHHARHLRRRPARRGPGTAALGPGGPAGCQGGRGGAVPAGACEGAPLFLRRRAAGILTSRRILESRSWQRDGHDHLHPHRRGAAAGDVLLPPHRLRVCRARPASRSRPVTSRWRGASWLSSASPTTRWPSSVS